MSKRLLLLAALCYLLSLALKTPGACTSTTLLYWHRRSQGLPYLPYLADGSSEGRKYMLSPCPSVLQSLESIACRILELVAQSTTAGGFFAGTVPEETAPC